MKNFLSIFFIFVKSVLNKLIPFLVKYRMFNLLSLLLIINLSKIKKILPKETSKYKVIVLSKSAGIDDLIEGQKKLNKDILYLECPRIFFKKIFFQIFRNIDNIPNDCNYESKNKKIIELKEQYKLFLINLLLSLNKRINIDAFLGFNFNYFAERELHSACSELNIPFLILYKESVLTELEKKFKIFAYQKKKDKFFGYKIAVYSNSAKQFLIDSNITDKKKIEVVGCSRLSVAKSYQNISPKNQIIYYAIENDRGLPDKLIKQHSKNFFRGLGEYKKYKKKFDWTELNIKILNTLKKFAYENPKIPIIIKTKTGDKSNDNLFINLPKNIKIYNYETGHKAGHTLLENSKIVIAWNTTAILEAIAANRYILLPNFYKKNNFLKSVTLKIKLEKENYCYNESDLINKLNFFIKKNYQKNIINNNKKSLEYYLGEKKNDSRIRLNNFIKNNLNIRN
jgi:hypothetical protein